MTIPMALGGRDDVALPNGGAVNLSFRQTPEGTYAAVSKALADECVAFVEAKKRHGCRFFAR
jgi:hypothetical protein